MQGGAHSPGLPHFAFQVIIQSHHSVQSRTIVE
jgi:hypothetical protein